MAGIFSKEHILLLDGGLATELEAMGHDINHMLWSAKLLLENPQAIVDAHLAYLRAGAQCIISASHQASIPGFLKLGWSRAQAVEAIMLSVELARQAVSQYCAETDLLNQPLVAASVGPWGAHLGDGSEYHAGLSPAVCPSLLQGEVAGALGNAGVRRLCV